MVRNLVQHKIVLTYTLKRKGVLTGDRLRFTGTLHRGYCLVGSSPSVMVRLTSWQLFWYTQIDSVCTCASAQHTWKINNACERVFHCSRHNYEILTLSATWQISKEVVNDSLEVCVITTCLILNCLSHSRLLRQLSANSFPAQRDANLIHDQLILQ